MLSAHSSGDELGKSYVCVWNVTQPSAPNKVLVASGGVTECCFSPLKASVAIAGLVDGAVCAWDLREALSFHQEVARSEVDAQEQYSALFRVQQANYVMLQAPTYNWQRFSLLFNGTFETNYNSLQDIFRSPTFTTSSGEDGHNSAVTAVKPLPEPQDDSREKGFAAVPSGSSGGFSTFQLVTVEERGQLIVWTVLGGQRDVDQHIGLAHWGSVRLVRTMVLDLAALHVGTKGAQLGPEVNSFDVTFDPDDGSRVYVGTESGSVLHASVQG